MIVITTPTGQIGHRTLQTLLDHGEVVRVIVREASRLPPDVRERVDTVQGSHKDSEVLDKAFGGADRVLWVVPPDPGADSVQRHYLDFALPACDALRRHGVERVVGVTSLGRDYAKPAGLLSGAFAMDELIDRAGVSYRALGMPFFMENLLGQIAAIKGQGMFFLANDADRPLACVATRDIAAAAAALLLDASWSGQERVPVVGPDALSPNGMASVMSEVLGRPVRFQHVPGAAYKATLLQYGMSEAFAQGIIDMQAAQDDGIYDAEQRSAQPAPTSFRAWCEDTLKPAVLS